MREMKVAITVKVPAVVMEKSKVAPTSKMPEQTVAVVLVTARGDVAGAKMEL